MVVRSLPSYTMTRPSLKVLGQALRPGTVYESSTNPRGQRRPTETEVNGLRVSIPLLPKVALTLADRHSLIIITARSEKQREGTEDWIAMYMPDSTSHMPYSTCPMLIRSSVFDEIHFTGAFQHLEPTPEEKEGHAAKRAYVSHTKRSKAEVS